MSQTNSSLKSRPRQVWSSRIGVIMAVAGSAVGLGNFLRFPVQAAQNGGGAFMIPYFVALILLGIPLMWVEWAMGRYGGRYSHGSAPGIFDAIAGRRGIYKHLGAVGLLGPLLIVFYYMFIESWTLGYAFYALTGKLGALKESGQLRDFLSGYQGVSHNEHFRGLGPAYVFFVLTFALNFGVVYLGVVHGIERVNKIAMPLLAVLGVILTARVLTLGAPDPAHSDWNVSAGLGFLWNPDLSRLQEPKVWLAAAGQILFTLSVGIGTILTYGSYLKPQDDVALSGLTASATNEFFEVIIGGSVVIPAAVVFFGAAQAVEIAQSGSFNLGFVTMPLIFTKMLGGQAFCVMWFLLLFLAGLTSSISLLQPAISFLEDELHFRRHKAVGLTALVCFAMCQLAIFGLGLGAVDEMDFWGGTFLIVLSALVELVVFGWVFGMRRGWEELHVGAEIRIPRVFRFVIQFVTPLYVLIMLVWFCRENWRGVFLMENYQESRPFILVLRLVLLLLLAGLCWLIHYSWKRHPKHERPIS